MKKSKASP